MNVAIFDQQLSLTVHGFSGTALNKDYAGTAFKLMDKMWRIVKSNNLKNKGLNIWVYDDNDSVFAGVELDDTPNPDLGLKQNNIELLKYASYKHIGPYQLIKQAGQQMTVDLKEKGYETRLPYIEIYGQWTNDETKLETDLLMCLK